MKKYSEEQIRQANAVNIIELAKRLGYSPEKFSNNYRIKSHGGLLLSEQRNAFYSFADETGGGPIQFAMYARKCTWLKAMEYLAGEAELQQVTVRSDYQKTEPANKEFVLPEKSKSSFNRLFAYLIKTRGLDKDIVSDLVAKKKIYESAPHHNVVFVGYDENGTPKEAFQRGTVSGLNYKGEVPGSDKNYGFTMEGTSDRLVVFEAAIDSISHASLLKMMGEDWRLDNRLSLGCTADKTLIRYLESHPNIKEIRFALDNDSMAKYKNGEPAPNHGQIAADRLAKKYAELGYKTMVEAPKAKDWNEDLLNIKASYDTEEKLELLRNISNSQNEVVEEAEIAM